MKYKIIIFNLVIFLLRILLSVFIADVISDSFNIRITLIFIINVVFWLALQMGNFMIGIYLYREMVKKGLLFYDSKARFEVVKHGIYFLCYLIITRNYNSLYYHVTK